MRISAISKKELTPSYESFDIHKFAPNLSNLISKLLPDTNAKDYKNIKLAFTTTRTPGNNSKESNPKSIQLPLVESFRRQFKNLNSDEQKDFIDSLGSNGFFGTADGTKIQIIHQACGQSAADAVIVGNLEVLLQTAKDLNAKMLLGIYSGDENIFGVAPNDKNISQAEFKKLFNEKLAENLDEYYSNPFWQPMKNALKKAFPLGNKKIGLTASLVSADKVMIYTPTIYDKYGNAREYVSHLRTALGSIIDATSELYIPPLYHKPLLSIFERMLNEEDDLEVKNAEYEQMYSDYLKIRKIGTLDDSIKEFRETNADKPLYFIRLADIMMKYTNSKSHTLGDHNMIATINFIQNQIQAKLNIDPHHNINYFQHNGSFMLMLGEEEYEKVSALLNDPVTLNNALQLNESQRPSMNGQDPSLRALPFIVSSTQISSESGFIAPKLEFNENSSKAFELIDKLRIEQTYNETLVALYTSGIANQILHPFINLIENILNNRGISPRAESATLLKDTFINLEFFANLFGRYSSKRANNVTILSQKLEQDRSSLRFHIKNLRRLLSI